MSSIWAHSIEGSGDKAVYTSRYCIKSSCPLHISARSFRHFHNSYGEGELCPEVTKNIEGNHFGEKSLLQSLGSFPNFEVPVSSNTPSLVTILKFDKTSDSPSNVRVVLSSL
ncbi:hypothetical protein M408DRAFT_163927 [Serendipita vermifera MAFF 305830]|uniref:Uncharacterized protein n=1 Tax=Serendipita vermifera MAFF 305830 TaxID=933852 RepID=A0A0C3AT45_SERVB|nr:hypothetical protein M408DRAFT_163927 [Serendipita vermifera MAFF 305830]